MNKTDAIGRATFHHIASQDGVRVTNREIRWLKHIERHGPQSSVYLYELTKDTHRSKDQALRDLQKLRAGGYLFLPPQQRATERAEFNPYIYDLTKQAKRWLTDQGLAEPTVRPTGHWWHAYIVSCVTSSIDIAAARDGVRYIPAHEILARKRATLGIPVNGKTLIPDQLFALDYGGSYRAFVLEVDRGTEPDHSARTRKSLRQTIDLYQVGLISDFFRSHFGLHAPVLSLWVFSCQSRTRWFTGMLKDRCVVQKMALFAQSARPNSVWLSNLPLQFYNEPWTGLGASLRVGRPAPSALVTELRQAPTPKYSDRLA
jgi:Replication-relaxation